MKQITFNLESDCIVTIFFNSTLSVFRGVDGKVKVMDGNHNNGGWHVKESYAEVIALIQASLAA